MKVQSGGDPGAAGVRDLVVAEVKLLKLLELLLAEVIDQRRQAGVGDAVVTEVEVSECGSAPQPKRQTG